MNQNKHGERQVDEGWSVLVYGGDRRLILYLERSHLWTLTLGLGVGLVLGAILGVALPEHRPSSPSSEPSKTAPILPID